MKRFVAALLIGAAVVAAPALPAHAGEQEDAFAACMKELGGRQGLSQAALKTFKINKSGDGYEVIGFDDNNQRLICKTKGTKVRSVTAA